MHEGRVGRRIPADRKLEHGEQKEREDKADLKIAEEWILLQNTGNGESYARQDRS